ncbi:MAG: DUF3325 domain-containing protein [Burkholderiaceae bacterium]
MTIWTATTLGFAAFFALSLAMPRHQLQVLGREVGRRATLGWRTTGWLLLAAALAVCLTRWNASIAIAAWLGAATFAAMAVGLALTYRPRALPVLAGAALAIAVLIGLIG